jgi:hypothetical protein
MELQRYPSVKDGVDGDVVEPYDVAGWTLPLQMGVWAESVTSPVDLTTLKQISAQDLIPPSTSMLTPGRYLLSGRDNAAWFLINGALGRKDTPLPHRVTERAATAEVGDFVVTVNNTNRDALAKLMTTLRLKETDASVLKTRPMKKKRIGLYQSDIPNMDEGWTRWVLDHYGFEYRVLKNEDFKSRDLTRECDVILMPSMKRDAIKDGFNQGRYLSMAASIPQGQLTGIGDAGLALLKSFVENGNTLVLLDAAWEIALKEFALPVSNQLEGLTSQDIFIPGSLIRVLLDNQDPLAWGMPRECALYLTQGPVFRTTPTDNPRIRRFGVGRFSDEGPHLLSGYAKGEKHLNRGLTALRFNWERGNVVLLAGRVQHRSQTTATFKLLFNALFL